VTRIWRGTKCRWGKEDEDGKLKMGKEVEEDEDGKRRSIEGE
jgi:hypothetical protein